jgi:pyridoxamine 5'-phosphate oxidase
MQNHQINNTMSYTNNATEFINEPMKKFDQWYQTTKQATASITDSSISTLWPVFTADAMTLATCTSDGHPSVRTVLRKGHSEQGITFCTNYSSRKGNDIAENSNVALLFYWTTPVTRQIRIEGRAVKVSREESNQMFHDRPVASQIASAVSQQSKVVDSRDTVDRLFSDGLKHYDSTKEEVECPSEWGGYLVEPLRIEFWQEGDHRLADRIVYVREDYNSSNWTIQRLYP